MSAVVLKACRDCGCEKPLDEFPIQRQGRLGRHPLCKVCRAAQERRRYRRDRERLLAQMKGDAARSRRVRRRSLVRKYGLTEETVEALRVRQSGCCLICWLRRPLVVDHDHRTGEVRGLLCGLCNFAVGELEDDSARCLHAAEYLMKSAP